MKGWGNDHKRTLIQGSFDEWDIKNKVPYEATPKPPPLFHSVEKKNSSSLLERSLRGHLKENWYGLNGRGGDGGRRDLLNFVTRRRFTSSRQCRNLQLEWRVRGWGFSPKSVVSLTLPVTDNSPVEYLTVQDKLVKFSHWLYYSISSKNRSYVICPLAPLIHRSHDSLSYSSELFETSRHLTS